MDAASHTPGLRRWYTAQTGIFLGLWAVLMVVGRSRLFQDPGTFWHLALGQDLLAGGEFTRHDQFTFTHDGQPWIALQWLPEGLMAVGYTLGGWDTLLLGAAALLAALYAWVAGRCIHRGLHPLPAVVLTVIVIAASAHHFHVRPHLASIALLGATFALLCDVESGRRPLWQLAWLLPLDVLWTNMHGGVLGGIATTVIVFGLWCAAALLGRPSPVKNWRHIAWLALLLLGAGLATLANPYGAAAPRAWLTIMDLPLQEVIAEHRPLSLLRPEGLALVVLGVGYLALLRDVGWRKLRATWLLPLVWLVLAFLRVRHAPLAAVVTALAMAEVLPHSRLAAWLAKYELFRFNNTENEEKPSHAWRPAVLPVVVLLAALALQTARVPAPVVGAGWARLDPERWPVELVPQLRQLQAGSTQRVRLLNALEFGGFVTLHAPNVATLIDDRCELFGPFLLDYVQAERGQVDRIDEWTEQYDVTAALVRTGTPLDAQLRGRENWRPLRRTPAATLYLRRDKYPLLQSGRTLAQRTAGNERPQP